MSKHVVKSKGDKRAASSDAASFNATYNYCLQTFGNDTYNVGVAMDALPVPKLEALKEHLKAGWKKPNSAKIAEIHEFFPEY